MHVHVHVHLTYFGKTPLFDVHLSACNFAVLADGEILESQGCFDDNPQDRDLPFEVSVSVGDEFFPDLCRSRCLLISSAYTYAGVQVDNRHDVHTYTLVYHIISFQSELSVFYALRYRGNCFIR